MDIIKIKRETIEKNKDRHLADHPITIDNGRLYIDFECDGMPTWCDDSVYRINYVKDGRLNAELIDVSDRDAVLEFIKKGSESGQNFSGSMRRDPPIEIYAAVDEPEYLYDYDNESPVTCSNCGTTMPIGKVETIEWVNEDGDDVESEVCPVCKEHDTFNYKLESVYDALKR